MNSKLFWLSPLPNCLLSVIILVFIEIPLSSSKPFLCSKPFTCGKITTGYPFWGGDRPFGCGHPDLLLHCEGGQTMIEINDLRYRVINVSDTNQTLKIAREDYLLYRICPPQLANTTLDPMLFELASGYENFTLLYGCPSDVHRVFNCSTNDVNYEDGSVERGSKGPGDCSTSVTVPLTKMLATKIGDLSSVEQALIEGFEVKWKVDMTECRECICSYYDSELHQLICYCPNQPHPGSRTCPQKGNGEYYTSCSKPFTCGMITTAYPFWGNDRLDYCGHPELKLDCKNDSTTIEINGLTYRVLHIDNDTQTLKIAREDYLDGICPPQLANTTLDSLFFDYAPGYGNLTIHYGCLPSLVPIPSQFTCPINGVALYGYVQSLQSGLVACYASVIVPVLKTLSLLEIGNSLAVEEALKEGFEVKWKVDSRACQECTESNGKCGFDPWSQTTCYCLNQPLGWFKTCSSQGSSRRKRNVLVIAISLSVVGTMAALIVVICARRRKLMMFKKNRGPDPMFNDPIEAFIKNYGALTLKRYSYADVKRMTNSFTDKLGQGGYGAVYKGKLPDGRLVAMKVLSESKGNGEVFINEVASISRTSHVNVVTLVGFCYEKTKRALIYEFMPNGSLDKFLCDQDSLNTKPHLEWKTLYQIAVGIARGLEYLHRGCNTRILHFDIKPHNILLDENFCPKISDFGLAKLCKRDESIISMLGARGTIGYIAPEVFCRNFGGVSHKSDVYSYGMMVLEMVGGRKNSDGRVSETSEKYFPEWIYKQLEPGEEFKLHGVTTDEEEEIARKMIIVSMCCIQTNPPDRPSMTKVVEMLEGRLQSLQIPPKPFLSSSPRSAQPFSMTSSSANESATLMEKIVRKKVMSSKCWRDESVS